MIYDNMNEKFLPLKNKDGETELVFPTGGWNTMLPPSIRSLDEIDAWIQENSTLFYNRDAYFEEKRKMSVYEKFVL